MSGNPFHPGLMALRRVRRALRAGLVAQRALWLVAVAVAAAIGMGLADFALRLPAAARGGALALGVVLVVVSLGRRVLLAVRFRPPLEDLALRLEARGEPGPNAVNLLASGVDFSRGLGDAPATPGGAFALGLKRGVVDRAGALSGSIRAWRLVRWRPIALAAGAAAGCLLGAAGLRATTPDLFGIGARRVLLPWSGAAWPKRFAVADLTTVQVHPLGSALPLRAAMLTRAGDEADGRVEATYRLVGPDGTRGPLRRLVLTSQARRVPLPDAPQREGTLHERILDAAALEYAADLPAAATTTLEYTLTTRDDATALRTIRLVRPPAVVAVSAYVAPPAYAAASPEFAPRGADLGTGTDQRATLGGVLAGSRVELTIALNKPVPAPAGTPGAARDWLGAALGEAFARATDDPAADLRLDFSTPGVWRVAATVSESVRLPVRAVDEHGVQSDGEAMLRIEAVADRPPEATIIRPDQDIEVLASASVEVVAEARDDVAVRTLAAEYRVARRAGGSVGAAPEAEGDLTTLAAVAEPARTLRTTARLDLDALKAKPGEEYWLTAIAHDAYEWRGTTHEPVRSAVRRVKVISEQQLTDQVWADLAGVRRAAQRLAEQQQAARAGLDEGRDARSLARDQAGISETTTRQDQSVARLDERLTENGLADSELARVLDEARTALRQATAASSDAAERLKETHTAREAGDADAAREAAAGAAEQQDRARAEFEALAELLDKGQDTWSTTRALERMLAEQRALREATSAAGRATVGRTADELTGPQRQAMEQLGDQQEELARRAEETLRKMREKAEQMREADPAAAAAMNDAAQRGRSANLPEQMERAGRDIRQNRQQSATQQQDRAARALQDMLEEMNAAARSKDQTLARQLASLIESIEGLIARQEGAIKALDAWAAGGANTGLDAEVIRLRTLTLGAAEQARAAGREARGVAAPLDAAAGAQAEAVKALRATGATAEGARTHETLSLAKLNEALERAREAQQQAQENNARAQRAELRKGYRELLDVQTEVRERTVDAAKLEAGRRQRAAARELAEPQDRVRTLAAELERKTAEIADTEVFRFAHKRLDDASGFAASRLAEGDAGPAVQARQASALRVLRGVLEALAETAQKKDDFRENAGGSGQGQGGGSGQTQPKLIPPGAELRLLRGMQAEALELTRIAADEPGADGAATREEAATLQAALAERAATLLKKLKEQARPGEDGGPANPRPVNPGE